MRAFRWTTALVILSVGFLGCDKAPDDGSDDDTGDDTGMPLPPDKCNSADDARNVPECQLQLGVEKVEYIGLQGDVDWYSVTLPTGLTSRSLLHVSAGYSAPATAVNLSVNVLLNGTQSIGLMIMVQDQSGKNFDWRNPYTLKVEVVDDPDTNEPNDTTPTPLPLNNTGAALVGTATGFLATTDDVDEFSLAIPTDDQVLYLSVTGPAQTTPPPYRMSYTMIDATGTPVAQGVMSNAYIAIDLATARRMSKGTYTLQLTGYHWMPDQHIAGDLALRYTVMAMLIPELDTNEPNETIDTAKAQTLSSPGATASIKGRLGEVPDADWYAFDLPATTHQTVFYYHLTPGSASGRFPALPGPLDRQLRVFTEVTKGANTAEQQNNCVTDPSVCPKRDDATDDMLATVADYCSLSTPRCMWSGRQEDLKYDKLRNFEGAIPVAAHTGTVRYYVLVEDSGNDWADDVEYTLDVTWRDDADETSRFSGTQEQTISMSMIMDGAASTFPAPPTGSNYELNGTLSYGNGYWRNNDPLHGEGVRAHDDYDAYSSDSDRYELVFPSGLAAPLDQTWELQWEVEKDGPNGSAPFDLALDVEFCDGSQGAGGTCNSVNRTLGYTGGDLGSWHSAGVMGAPFQPVYSQLDMTDRVQVTALAWGCFCIEPRFVQAGHFYVKVVAVDRNGYADVKYHVRTALTAYPKPYNGGMCPAPTQNTDGTWAPGCKFAE